MRTLDRNKRRFYYCLHQNREKIYDENHNFTGEYSPEYAEPVEAFGNISASSGTTDTEQFGNDISYDKTIALQGTDWPIDESTVLLIDTLPDPESDIPNYDYLIVRKAVSLNHTVLAIKRVEK